MARRGLYSNIHAKRKRIANGSGEQMRKPGSKGAPKASDFKRSAKTAKPKMSNGGTVGKDSRISRAGVSGYNKPKSTPNHPKKSHIVVAKEGDKIKTIRFGQQGVEGAGSSPKSSKEKSRQKRFKARHAKNISKGKMSAAYWSDKVKW